MIDTESWTRAATVDEIDDEDVIDVELDGRTIALYFAKGQYFATDGICSHEHAYLADGFVFGTTVECPKHQGRFDIRTGQAKAAPACLAIRTYPVTVVGEDIFVQLDPARGS